MLRNLMFGVFVLVMASMVQAQPPPPGGGGNPERDAAIAAQNAYNTQRSAVLLRYAAAVEVVAADYLCTDGLMDDLNAHTDDLTNDEVLYLLQCVEDAEETNLLEDAYCEAAFMSIDDAAFFANWASQSMTNQNWVTATGYYEESCSLLSEADDWLDTANNYHNCVTSACSDFWEALTTWLND